MFLMIQNEGIAPVEAFTLLGDSGTRHCGVEGVIGQFGSGTKHAITLLLRKGIEFHIYSGRTRLEFFSKSAKVRDANGELRDSFPVKCRLSGDKNRTIDCGWTLEFGALDWRETSMALREFVSNAIDCSKILDTEPVIDVKPNRRSKADTTRVFITLRDADVCEFYRNLGEHFLHFSSDPSQVDRQFLRKNPSSTGAIIYREGVKIRTLRANYPAAYDYNFRAEEIEIDECRNSSEYALRATIGQAINKAGPKVLSELFAQMSKEKIYEGTLDDFYLGYSESDSVKENWVQGWKDFAGESVIATTDLGGSPVAEHVAAKGHHIKVVQSDAFVKVAHKMGVPNITTVLGQAAAAGRVQCDTTEEAQKAVDTVWSWIEATEMTGAKGKPAVKCFKQLMDAESECLGYYSIGSDEVNLRDDLAGKIALKTAIEEVAHYVTGSTDCSRDFQNYAFDMIVELCV